MTTFLRNYKLPTIIYYGVVAVLVVIGLLVAFSALPIQGNYQLKTVLSGSMEPAIGKGSIVVVKPADSYAEGDVITFEKGFKDSRGRSIAVTHRVVEVVEEAGAISFVTQGDANNGVDSKSVPVGDVIGSVAFSVPYVGYAVATAATPYGFIGLLVIPGLVIIYGEVMTIWRELKTARKKPLNEEAV